MISEAEPSRNGADANAAAVEFLEKWRARWPEWRIARVFIAQAQRPLAEAWFALLQEWADAAWAGVEPAPGLAKLSWWQEELSGWSKGARRHPLGHRLHKHGAPWARLSASLPVLHRSRDALRRYDASEATLNELLPLAACIAECEAALFAAMRDDAPHEREASYDDSMRTHAAAEATAAAAALASFRLWSTPADARAEAAAFARALCAYPSVGGTPPRRVFDAMARARMAQVTDARGPEPAAPLRVLWSAWRAARG